MVKDFIVFVLHFHKCKLFRANIADGQQQNYKNRIRISICYRLI